jgi:hypothetical protein
MSNIETDFLIQVNSYGVWEDITVIPMQAFQNKKDISLHLNSKQIDQIRKYEGKLMRLITPVIRNNEILFYNTKQFDDWVVYRNNYVLCINANKNYKEHRLETLKKFKDLVLV